jgi:hypothetical protein
MISSTNQNGIIWDLSNLTFEIELNKWRDSMNVGSKCHIAWNHSGCAAWLLFCIICRTVETDSLCIQCFICNQVIPYRSELVNSSLWEHTLAKVHISKLSKLTGSEFTELTYSTVHEAALPKLKAAASRGIPIVCWEKQYMFDI